MSVERMDRSLGDLLKRLSQKPSAGGGTRGVAWPTDAVGMHQLFSPSDFDSENFPSSGMCPSSVSSSSFPLSSSSLSFQSFGVSFTTSSSASSLSPSDEDGSEARCNRAVGAVETRVRRRRRLLSSRRRKRRYNRPASMARSSLFQGIRSA